MVLLGALGLIGCKQGVVRVILSSALAGWLLQTVGWVG